MKKIKRKRTSELKSLVRWMKVKNFYKNVLGINLYRQPSTILESIITSTVILNKLLERRSKRISKNFPSGGSMKICDCNDKEFIINKSKTKNLLIEVPENSCEKSKNDIKELLNKINNEKK